MLDRLDHHSLVGVTSTQSGQGRVDLAMSTNEIYDIPNLDKPSKETETVIQ
jgi:hypothetical protein